MAWQFVHTLCQSFGNIDILLRLGMPTGRPYFSQKPIGIVMICAQLLLNFFGSTE
jgi:hypothetical protein